MTLSMYLPTFSRLNQLKKSTFVASKLARVALVKRRLEGSRDHVLRDYDQLALQIKFG